MAAPDFAFDKAAFTAWCEAQCDNKDWRRDMTLKMLPLLVKELLTEKQRAYVVSYLLTPDQAKKYAGWKGRYIWDCKPLHGWDISELKVYDKPKNLRDFFQWSKYDGHHRMNRPPQSWCYVEESV